MIDKIRKIKESRLNKADKFLFNIIYNLTEYQTESSIVKYMYNNKLIFEYDIDTYILYMDFKTYEDFEYIFTKKYTEFEVDAKNYIVELLYKYFTYDTVKREPYYIEVNKLLMEEGNIQYNPLFNSITGKCTNIKELYPILV